MVAIPGLVPNWIGGLERAAEAGESFPKLNPHDGREVCRVTRSREGDVRCAVDSAAAAFAGLVARDAGEARRDPLRRGRRAWPGAGASSPRSSRSRPASRRPRRWARPTAPSRSGRFMAGEGQRMYGRTTTSGTPDRYASTVRQPIGVAGLIIAANTPIANVAWKVFPALVCGNAAVLKAAEDTPLTAWLFAAIAHEAGLPAGRAQRDPGARAEAGEPLVAHPEVAVHQLHGLDRGRAADRPDRGRAAGAGVAGARRQEPVRRGRRCRSRRGPQVGDVCPPSATRASAAPRAAASSCSTRSTTGSATRWCERARAPPRRAGRRRRLRPGDQPAPARQRCWRCLDAATRDGAPRAHRRRAADRPGAPGRLLSGADAARGRTPTPRSRQHGAVRAGGDAVPRRRTSRRRWRSPTARPTG